MPLVGGGCRHSFESQHGALQLIGAEDVALAHGAALEDLCQLLLALQHVQGELVHLFGSRP